MRNVGNLLRAAALVAAFLLPLTAFAHPHVSVSVKSTLLAGPDGKVSAVRHVWTFDEPFSAYATMGLDTDKDGKLSRAELDPLAKVNVESLQEYGFFTYLRKGKENAGFGDVKEFHLTHDGKALTLHFTLPVTSAPGGLKDVRFEVYDPTFFVNFTLAEQSPVVIEGDGGKCSPRITPPKPSVFQRLSQLGEGFFEQKGSAGLDAEWSTPVRFDCK